MSLVRDDWLYSAEGLNRLQRALQQTTNAQLRMNPTTNSLQLSFLDEGEDEEELLRANYVEVP